MAGKPKDKRSEHPQAERDGTVDSVTTIVGGQPPRRLRAKARVPIGIEKVLYLAASNPAFRKELLGDRPAAIGRLRLKLSEVERTTLLGVPRPALEAMIARISPEQHGKRSFMKTVAAATVSLAAGVVAPGCGDDDDRTPDTTDVDVQDWGPDGVRPDVDAEDDAGTADVEPPDASRGISADVPDEVDVDAPPEYAPGGVMPDADIDAGWEPDSGTK